MLLHYKVQSVSGYFGEIVYCKPRTKHTHTRCGQNVKYFEHIGSGKFTYSTINLTAQRRKLTCLMFKDSIRAFVSHCKHTPYLLQYIN